jgi:hypothetical protein
MDGTVSPERGTRRSFLAQRQIEILRKRCSISKARVLQQFLNSDVDSQSAGSQEGDGATADQNNASLAQAIVAIEASTSVKTKSKGARSRRELLMFLCIIFIQGVLFFLQPETLSIVKLNITHFVGVRKAAESVRIVSQAVEDDRTMEKGVDDDRTMEEGVDDDWIVEKARRVSLMSNCWL